MFPLALHEGEASDFTDPRLRQLGIEWFGKPCNRFSMRLHFKLKTY